MKKTRSWDFDSDGRVHCVRVDLDPELPGGGAITVHTAGTHPFAEAGGSLTLAEFGSRDLPGPRIPRGIWNEITAFIFGEGDLPAPAAPDGPVMYSFSWEEGYDWEFYYLIEAYRNGVMFTASGEAGRGIDTQQEFQSFDRPSGIEYPSFMGKSGHYDTFLAWLDEYEQLRRQDRRR